jgi:hypothetical protein
MILKMSVFVIGLLFCALPCFAANGIAVSTQINIMQWGSNGEATDGGDIFRYDIANNQVTKTTMLINGGGGDAAKAKSRARFPAINIEGTKIAYFRITSDSGSFVSVMNIDGTGSRDLARIPSQSGYDGKGYLSWTREGTDEWVYYIMAGGNFANAGNKLLWRVNAADPTRNEQVAAFNFYLWQWGLSADGSRAFLRPSENQQTSQLICYLMPGNGTLSQSMSVGYGAGCANGISPSGLYVMYLSGGTHTSLYVDDWLNKDPNKHAMDPTSDIINTWIVNGKSDLTTSCPDWGTVVAGMGMSCNRWSSNSDKWLCLCMGWPDAGSGRFLMCGSNQVVCDWKDKTAIMTSANPRMCIDNALAGNCDKNLAFVSGKFFQNDAGDFWCATVEDVNQDLRQYVNIRKNSPVVRGAMPVAAYRADNRLVIDIQQRGSFRAIVRNCAGQTLFALSGTGPLRKAMPAGPGVYFVSVIINDRKFSLSSAL